LLTALENRMVLPRIHPSYYHLLAILLSVLFLYAQTPWQKIALLGVVLTTDWLDGATAKRYGEMHKAGYVIDTVTDRVSEAFLFSAGVQTVLGQVFFLLWLVNCALTFYSIGSNKHTSLPLRFAYLMVLIFQWM
jgi:phosphatidylglycerophosphate synthase